MMLLPIFRNTHWQHFTHLLSLSLSLSRGTQKKKKTFHSVFAPLLSPLPTIVHILNIYFQIEKMLIIFGYFAISAIVVKSRSRRVRVIGVCGPSASGKSTLAQALSRKTDAVLISQDEFFQWTRFQDEKKKGVTPILTVNNRTWKNWETFQAVNFGTLSFPLSKTFFLFRCPKHTQRHAQTL